MEKPQEDALAVPETDEIILIEEVDIEIYAREGKRPPHARRYRIRVDRDYFVTTASSLTGRQILELAGRLPVERFGLRQRHHGGQVVSIALDQVVDLTQLGIERFTTIPKDQTEGADA